MPNRHGGCRTAMALFELYIAALSAFHKSQDVILAGVSPSHSQYPEVHDLREHVYQAMETCRSLYWKHLQEHGCRNLISSGSELANTPKLGNSGEG